jgi:hypothetical protein
MDSPSLPPTQTAPRRRTRRKKSNGNTPGKVLRDVRVRMYRQGLGDCFLLTFTNTGQKQHHMLIDCGVLPFSHAGDHRLDLIAQDILAESGQRLDTVVATHEHADHISGFKSAAEFFGLNPEKKPVKPVEVDNVWLAWTENQEDEQVKKIIARTNGLSLAIAAAMQAMGAERSASIQDILLFGGTALDEDGEAALAPQATDAQGLSAAADASNDQILPAAAKFKLNQSMALIMDWLRKWGKISYLEPGDIRELPEFGVKFYILGPSRKMAMLGGSAPGGQGPDGGQELKLSQAAAFMAAAVKYSGLQVDEEGGAGLSPAEVDALYRLSLPFDPARFLPLAEAQKPYPLAVNASYPEKLQASYRDFFKRVYGFGDDAEGIGPEWRRIDDDWLQMGETLALQQVSTVNNTSLVMAIELVESGQVMLFVGDAEQESWETWENKKINLNKLLAKTVLYKVGHHGSINGTDQDILTGKLTNPDLAALLPVDVQRAIDKKWEFPAATLYNLDPSVTDDAKKGLLFKQTRGRILMNCGEECMKCDPSYDESRSWLGKIEKDLSPDKLWVDYTLA